MRNADCGKRIRKLAIVTTHPIQYYAPWFRWMVANASFDLKVFYLWDPDATVCRDPGFGHDVQWDVPLLDGYEYELVANTAKMPGSSKFAGIRNPELGMRIAEFRPDAALLIGYRYDSLLRLIFTPLSRRGFPLLFRGDSHRLAEGTRNARSSNGTWKKKLRQVAIAQIYRRFAAFLYVGQANRGYFQMHGVRGERLFFAPHAVDNARFMSAAEDARSEGMKWRDHLGIPEGHQLVLFAGKFEEKKRPRDLLEAFAALQPTDVSLLFVGAGKLEGELRARAGEVLSVFFAPFQNQTQMPRTYAACDLFVLPSFGPEESWGLAINEALCLSKAVIVSSHVGCGADLLRPGENGLIFPAGEVAALTNALREALSDPARLARWGSRGREIVCAYDYAHATAGLERALDFISAQAKRGYCADL